MLLDRGTAVDSKNQHGRTPLHEVCCNEEENGLEIAKLLLDQGANVNAADEDGKTPLHLICDRRYNTNDYDNDFMQLLLDRGANVEAKTNDGLSPMYLACQRNALDIVWLLARQYPWLVMDQTSPTGESEKKRQRME